MTDNTDRVATIKQLANDLERLVAFADAEDDPVLAAKLEDARSVFNTQFVWQTE